jgi:hypothetical protein
LGNKTNACKDLKKAAELNSPAAYKQLKELGCQ